jgi:hypothetical protein
MFWIGTVVALDVSAILVFGVLKWMLLRVQLQSRGIKGELEQKADAAISSGQPSRRFETQIPQRVRSKFWSSAI